MEVRNARSLLLVLTALSPAVYSSLITMPGDMRYGGISMHSDGARRRFGMSFFVPRTEGDAWANPNDGPLYSPTLYGLEGSEGKVQGPEQSDGFENQDEVNSEEDFTDWLRGMVGPQEPLGHPPAVPNGGGTGEDTGPHHHIGSISVSVANHKINPDATITIVKD